ncbi:MAG TPA: bifunctional transaldolase/phosoglucose isomerase [Rhizomicrobium sp.]|nr:bifunctional transaldolase/phosoglucose isomerase [Rhizomicrobium sp.]
MNRVKQLERFGQAVWLDFLSREFLASDDFTKMIVEDGLKGMTSNPSIFEKAFAHGTAYDSDIAKLVEQDADLATIFRKLAIADIQKAADSFRPVYDRLNRADGFISMEVSPYIAYDTAATMAEARSLWREINRPNLMIKVPATKEGLPAIRDLTGEGLNINITLLFSRDVYAQVAEAYIDGLEKRPADENLSGISSVASFFVSRIDTKADNAIAERAKGGDKSIADLHGKVAVANAKLAYEHYKQIFSGPRWEKLAARGARPQRLLWASTGTKNKAYSDVLYVDTLIGNNTVNTMPRETLDAFNDHGKPQATIEEGLDAAKDVLKRLAHAGISLDAITKELVAEGVDLFAQAADKLYGALAEKRTRMLGDKVIALDMQLGAAGDAVAAEIKARAQAGDARRLWQKDASLWTNADEAKWLGWLDIAMREGADAKTFQSFAKWIRDGGFTDLVLIGMGGSSLGAEVLAEVFGEQKGWPRAHILDSTDPDQIATVESEIDIAKTAFVVSSKSGSTLEPNILKDYFFAQAGKAARGKSPGAQFVAITDPGSAMEKAAKAEGFAHIFYGDPKIGGRYSVLSKFGLIPAAGMGLDVERICRETVRFIHSCDAFVPANSNPAMKLGIALGVLATKFGRDKITILAEPPLVSVGAWMEQLIAESTGKRGHGLIPVDGECLGDAEVYGNDRVFLSIHKGDATRPSLGHLASKGHPVIDIALSDPHQIGQVFFLAEVATALAGAVIGINPFDQPDVETAKVKARDLTAQYEKGDVPAEKPIFTENGIALYADAANASALGRANTLAQYLKTHLGRIAEGDYFALLAFIERNREHDLALQGMRTAVRNKRHAATCVGFGPRYLHSTGQAYKGGPNSGVFVEITCDHAKDLDVPGRKITFGTVELAQALGDISVLDERKRRALRIHLKDVKSGLSHLNDAITEALQ